MEVESFREKTSWQVIAIIAIFLVIFAAVVFSIVMARINENPWLFVQCNVNLLKEFNMDVTDSEHARVIASALITVNSANAARFQYCSGYSLVSGDKYYFLCNDGRFYELSACSQVKQNETMSPFLPRPDIVIG